MTASVPLPSILSGDVEERLVRIDKSLFFIVAGALAYAADYQTYIETGALTIEEAREALGNMVWDFYNP